MIETIFKAKKMNKIPEKEKKNMNREKKMQDWVQRTMTCRIFEEESKIEYTGKQQLQKV